LRENYFLAATTRRDDTMKQLAIRQTYDMVAHVRFEIVQLENDWIDWCTECAINLKMSMKNELQVRKGKEGASHTVIYVSAVATRN
jgi:hypothetical protein